MQDAFATALERWPRDGVPRDPPAWLIAVARNRAIDRLRRERRFRALAPQLTPPEPAEGRLPVVSGVPDERLPWNDDGCYTEIRPVMDYEAWEAEAMGAEQTAS